MNLKIVLVAGTELYITGPDLIMPNINPIIFSSPPVTNVQSKAECEVAQDTTVVYNRITAEFSSGFISQQDFSKFIAWY